MGRTNVRRAAAPNTVFREQYTMKALGVREDHEAYKRSDCVADENGFVFRNHIFCYAVSHFREGKKPKHNAQTGADSVDRLIQFTS